MPGLGPERETGPAEVLLKTGSGGMVGAMWESFWLVPLYAVLMSAVVLFGRRLARHEERSLGAPRQCRVGPFERSVGTMLAFLVGFTFAMSGGDFREAQAT